MNRIFPFACLLAVVCMCCSPKGDGRSVHVYDAEHRLDYFKALESEMQLSMLCDSVESIPLDTAGGFLLEHVTYARFRHGHFFVLDGSEKLYVFDRSGHGRTCLSRKGQGPNEYFGIRGFDVTGDSLICLLTFPEKLMYFSMDGAFVKETKLPERGFELSLISDRTALIYKDNVGSTPDEACLMLDVMDVPTGNVSSYLPGYRFLAHRNLPSYQQRRTFECSGTGECLFVHPLSNLVYAVDGSGVHVKYELDFGNDNPPVDLPEVLPSSSSASDFVSGHFPVYGFNGCWENTRYFYLQFEERGHPRGLLYDKVSDSLYTGGYLNDDLTGCTPCFYSASDEWLAGYWTVDAIVSLGDYLEMRGMEVPPFFASLLNKADSVGNPVMCLYYFREK